MAKNYGRIENVESIVSTLQGDAFCQSRLLNLENYEKIDECQDFIGNFMPLALELLMTDIESEAQQLCFNIFEEVCSYP